MRVTRAGRLNKRFTIQRLQPITGTGDDREEYWKDLATVWGGIENVSGSEQNTGSEIMAVATHKITVRHFKGLSAKDRLVHKATGRIFNIVHPADDPTLLTDMELVCKEDAK